MGWNRGRVATAALIISVLSVSCAAGDGGSAPATQSATSHQSTEPSAEPSPTETYHLDDTTPELYLDDAAEDEALATAVAAWRAFARPDLDFDTWWAGLEPMLTQRSAESYFYADPANVVVLAVSDAAQIVDAPSGYEIHVEVATDRGGRTVVLLRDGEDEPWQVDRFVLPEGEG